jgi:hypothetical protein
MQEAYPHSDEKTPPYSPFEPDDTVSPFTESLRSAPPYSIETADFQCRLNIVIQVVGSRGDVQPFLALSAALQAHGHRVRIVTHDIFESFVTSTSIELFPVGGDPAELMAYMLASPSLIPDLAAVRAGEIARKRSMYERMLDGFWESSISPDPISNIPFVANAIIVNPPSYAHVHCAEARGSRATWSSQCPGLAPRPSRNRWRASRPRRQVTESKVAA